MENIWPIILLRRKQDTIILSFHWQKNEQFSWLWCCDSRFSFIWIQNRSRQPVLALMFVQYIIWAGMFQAYKLQPCKRIECMDLLIQYLLGSLMDSDIGFKGWKLNLVVWYCNIPTRIWQRNIARGITRGVKQLHL